MTSPSRILFLILVFVGLTSFLFADSGLNKKFKGTLVGKWKLTAYGYNPKGVEMEFDIVNDVVNYTFNADSTGTIDDLKNPIDFTWTLEKKDRLTLRTEEKTKYYKISLLSDADLVIVDQQGGKDRYKTYTAGEKGLIFQKYRD